MHNSNGLGFSDTNKFYSTILLGLMLPGIDGFVVCRKLREITDVPILMVTARKEDIDKIRELGLSADDYIEKPLSPNVLVARVKANLAQYSRLKESDAQKQTEINIGEFKINTSAHRVFKRGEEIELKNKEYELFLFLVMNCDVVFDKETIYEKIWGFGALGEGNIVNDYGVSYPLPFFKGNEDEEHFRDLLTEYKNVTFFNGHSHLSYDMQVYNPRLNITDYDKTTATMVHVSSVSAPRTASIKSPTLKSNPGSMSEGLYITVYPEYIIVTACDFIGGQFLAYATYRVDNR